jgi:hypothetical protein
MKVEYWAGVAVFRSWTTHRPAGYPDRLAHPFGTKKSLIMLTTGVRLAMIAARATTDVLTAVNTPGTVCNHGFFGGGFSSIVSVLCEQWRHSIGSGSRGAPTTMSADIGENAPDAAWGCQVIHSNRRVNATRAALLGLIAPWRYGRIGQNELVPLAGLEPARCFHHLILSQA